MLDGKTENDNPHIAGIKELKATSQNLAALFEADPCKKTVLLDTHGVFSHLEVVKNRTAYKDQAQINERTSNLIQFQSGLVSNLFVQGRLWRHLFFEDVDTCVLTDLKDLDYAAACFQSPLKKTVFSKLIR